MSKNKRIGKLGEEIAVQYLKKQGHDILENNFFTRIGEIDIISVKKNILYFIEVKTRTTKLYGLGFESINKRKIEKIKKSAEIYITDNVLWSGLIQFLCISIYYPSKENFSIDVLEIE